MQISYLVNDGHIVGSCLVVHAPSAPDELDLTIVDQVNDEIFHLVTLLTPPSPKEGCLDLDIPLNNVVKINKESGEFNLKEDQ